MLLALLDSSNMFDRVGNAVVSTLPSACVMQYSDVSGGKSCEHRVVSITGILLIRNDRRTIVVWGFSLRKVAFARISNAARIRSIIVVSRSPYICLDASSCGDIGSLT